LNEATPAPKQRCAFRFHLAAQRRAWARRRSWRNRPSSAMSGACCPARATGPLWSEAWLRIA